MEKIEIYDDDGSINIDEINQFEHLIGYKFPDSYRELLLQHNGLIPAKPVFEFIDRTTKKTGTRDVSFYGFGDHIPDYKQIRDAQEHDLGHTGAITIGETANGDFICFDYKSMPELNEPLIALMFHDRRDIQGKMLVNYVADSFDDFIDMLRKGED